MVILGQPSTGVKSLPAQAGSGATSSKNPSQVVLQAARSDERPPAKPQADKSPESQKAGLIAARQRRLKDAPRRVRNLYRQAWTGKSRKAAVRAFCLECVGWSPSEVANCTAPACPLYEYRLKG